jgi:DNA polymerase alpha subunit B
LTLPPLSTHPQAEQRSALCLVLLGPFIDEDHPTIASGGALGGTLGASVEHLFQSHVLARIQAFLEKAIDAGAAVPHVVLMPSPRDATARPAFPQPGFSRKGLSAKLSAHVHMAPNPCRVDVGGVSIATCSVDTLMTLGAAELASAPQPGAPRPDRMLRLAAHLLKQRLFMPLLPPPPDLPVDVTANLRSGGIDAMPDILLLPSQLAPFAKLMPADDGGALCLNPGKLTRNATGGSFALLSVHPRAQIDGARASDIGVRTAVQIVKI